MAAIHEHLPDVRFEIFTLVPHWFFSEALPPIFCYHPIRTDIGLIQESPLSEDPAATLKALDQFIPFGENQLSSLARVLTNANCACAICDISPLGIQAAKKAGIPAVLVENFTWDWIYTAYLQDHYGYAKYITILEQIYRSPDAHILAQPFCQPCPEADMEVWPISRSPKKDKAAVRAELGIPDSQQMILITMGGIPESFSNTSCLNQFSEATFVIPGGSNQVDRYKNLILLPHHSNFYHPDLINACDAAVGKAGYSTIAELFHAGLPFGYFTRPSFRESACLTAFIQTQLKGIELRGSHISEPDWIEQIPALLSLPRIERNLPNGADQIAAFIVERFF
jgi:hypothetical protein